MDPVWKITKLRQQLAVIDGKKAPDIVLKNARYLHSMLKQFVVGNIWILGDRIVYAGDRMPPLLEGTEVVDCTGKQLYQAILNHTSIRSSFIIHSHLQIFVVSLEQQLLFPII